MIQAEYGEFEVTCIHNGQPRNLILHVVSTVNHGHRFFLFDIRGWAVDDSQTIAEARRQYACGIAKEIKFF